MGVLGIQILVMLQVRLELILHLLHFKMEILLPYRFLYTLRYSCLISKCTLKPPETSVFSFSAVRHVLRNSKTQCYFEFSCPFLTPLLLFFSQQCQLGGPYIFLGLIVEFCGMTIKSVFPIFFRNQNDIGRLLIT